MIIGSRLTDGFSTTVTFANAPNIRLFEKTVNPSGYSGGGPIDTTTMRNTAWRTRAAKKLKSASMVKLTVAYASNVFHDIQSQLGVIQQITLTFPDTSTIVFSGWIEDFIPKALVEGEQPLATVSLVAIVEGAEEESSSPFFSSSAPPLAPPLTDLILWLRADLIELPDASLIDQWDDQSGHNNHATMGAGNPDNRPKILINQVNGLPVVSFDHASQSPYLEIPNFHHYAVSGAEIFAVLKAKVDPAPSTDGSVWSFGGDLAVTADQYPYIAPDGLLFTGFASTINRSNIPKSGSVASAFRVYSIASSANDHRVWLDGALINSSDINTVSFEASLTTHRLAANYSAASRWQGEIAELLIWGATLSNTERQQAIDYLADKYALLVSNINLTKAPSDISGLIAHWKADSITGLNDGDAVGDTGAEWEDQAGAYHLSQSTLSFRPIYKTNIYGTKPTVRFTKTSSHRLTFASGLSFPINTAFTVIIVGLFRTYNDGCVLGNSGLNNQFLVRRGGLNRISYFPGANELATTTDFYHPIDNLQMNVWRRASGVSGAARLMQNKTVNTNQSFPGNPMAMTINQMSGVVGVNYFDGDMCEICIYNTFLTDVEIFYLYDTYFKPRWTGLP